MRPARILIPLVALLAVSVLFAMEASDRTGCSGGEGIVLYRIAAKEEIRHDLSAYTQGLFIHEGHMYESTGQYGESSLRKVELATGKVLQQDQLPADCFGEGSCVFNGLVYILTWNEGRCFVYDIASFTKVAELSYSGPGWGLTHDGNSLIMSNGTSRITFRDPNTFAELRSITVKEGNRPVNYLNELEYIDGKIWANIYGLDEIFIIDPLSGQVTGKIDCRNLLDAKHKSQYTDVLNGIAYNPADRSVYLTGKYWPRTYKVTITEK